MSGFSPVGLAPLDYGPGTIRTDMSDAQAASLMMQTNALAAIQRGTFGGGGTGIGSSVQQVIHYWTETRLNPRQVTLLDSGGINNSATTFTVSLADANVLDTDLILKDRAQSLLVAEQMRIVSFVVGSTTATITIKRGENGTTPASHAQNAILEISAAPTINGSDLGRDQSRSPIYKGNLIQSHRKNVVVTGAMVSLARHGMLPGTPNQVAFQLHERWWELLEDMNRSLILGIGTPANVQEEAQTFWGLLAWLGYSNPVPNSTSVLFNANGSPITETLINQIMINIYLQGGPIPDAIIAHPYVIDRISRIFRDLIRIDQTDIVRGYTVEQVRTSIGNKKLKLIMDGYMPDPSVVEGVMAFVDLDRVSRVPFLDRECFLITSPTMMDADAISVMSCWTVEFRNTGTDSGYTSEVARNFAI